jgi:hypothetical protein
MVAATAFVFISVSMVRVVISARIWRKLLGFAVGAPALYFLIGICHYYAIRLPALVLKHCH